MSARCRKKLESARGMRYIAWQMTSDDHKDGADLLLNLNFEPDWAKKAPSVNSYAGKDRFEDRPRRDRDRPGRPPRDARDRDRRPPRREHSGERPERGRDPRREPRPPRVEPLNAEVHFLPEKNNIGAVVHLVRGRKQAFPLFGVASLFLSDARHYLIKLTAPKGQALEFHQCGVCQLVFLNKADLEQHILAAHLDEHFAVEEQETEPPAGKFVCVGRCPKTGLLLGPPNYHGFNAALQELHAKHYPGMSLQDCRTRIEMIHDPDVIEEWRTTCRRTTVYRPKSAGADAPGLTRDQAEALVREKHLKRMMHSRSRVILPASLIAQIPDESLTARIRQAWNRETKRPFTLALALQPALKHMGLHVFRSRGGDQYVSAIRPSPIDPGHAVPLIRSILEFIESNPDSKLPAVLEALAPGGASDSSEAAEVIQSLTWLIEKGHVIEYFDGTFRLPGGSRPMDKGKQPFEKERQRQDAGPGAGPG